ncbi:MAG: HD domain-containing protein [Fimbriimonadaceae bacterium]
MALLARSTGGLARAAALAILVLMPLLDRCLDLAVRAHAGQFREGVPAMPYAVHPVDVCCILRYQGNVTDETLLAAALLHDILEETDVEVEDIVGSFGTQVAELVLEVTREEPTDEQVEGMNKDQIYALRTSMLLDEIRSMSDSAKTIKLADRISNLREAMLTRKPLKLERYIRQSRQMLEVIPRELHPVLWDTLSSLTLRAESQLPSN